MKTITVIVDEEIVSGNGSIKVLRASATLDDLDPTVTYTSIPDHVIRLIKEIDDYKKEHNIP